MSCGGSELSLPQIVQHSPTGHLRNTMLYWNYECHPGTEYTVNKLLTPAQRCLVAAGLSEVARSMSICWTAMGMCVLSASLVTAGCISGAPMSRPGGALIMVSVRRSDIACVIDDTCMHACYMTYACMLHDICMLHDTCLLHDTLLWKHLAHM